MTRFILSLLALALLAPAARADAPDLRTAIMDVDTAAVRRIIGSGFNINAAFRPLGTSPVALAAIRGEGEIVRALLDADADPNAPGYGGMNALSMTVRSCAAKADIVAALIDAGADIEDRSGVGLTPLLVAIQTGRPDLARLLIERGADLSAVNMYGDGVLNYAIYYRQPTLVSRAVDAGVSPDQLKVLFTTTRYYQADFGADGLPVRRSLCGQ